MTNTPDHGEGPQFFPWPNDDAVADLQQGLHYSQAVRYRASSPHDRIEISGQGGWTASLQYPETVAAEIAQAFENITTVLLHSGATWDHVVAVDSFHVATPGGPIDEEHTRGVADQLRKRMPGRRPVWTEIGVQALGAPGMRVEVRVTAIVPLSTAASTADALG